jgi:hypothetical protein
MYEDLPNDYENHISLLEHLVDFEAFVHVYSSTNRGASLSRGTAGADMLLRLVNLYIELSTDWE